MISICIPIYNSDVRTLVHALKAQADSLNIVYELLLIDDASTNGCQKLNASLATLPKVRYIELEKNIGRSAIRNLLAKEASCRYLIFMDSDVQLASPDYVQKYYECCREGIVCYGGKTNLPECPAPECRLRWLYSVKREEPCAAERNLNPNRSFITYNFLIDKEIFRTVSFDETLKTYGHEDTVFGFRLLEAGIKVVHIDNPLLYCSFDDSITFIKKTELGIQNLASFYNNNIENKNGFAAEVKLLRAWKRLDSINITGFPALLFRIFRTAMLKNLTGKRPSIFVFDLYKLGYLCSFFEP